MSFFDEVELEDMEFDSETECYFFPCPCGDLFQISKDDIENAFIVEKIARCPSCSLCILVICD